ncbi:ABC transporter substrate-binding protein [Aeromonas taiwanensis]|uniref:ABC transporter substrate-binding protein n=1 Tax=Aeromonas taiwanensis TaxID=633417 RepID=A0A5F0KDE3_9GAMM|nr:transporter substrate-binding domain-containing protein [Aeromonas taiwanensis]TFF78483.1 ABC transporter substrate-binding protein [Aeromonas taiwanensis]TFF78945.1 ABC transporter substrate-binding protein [Aeromonas taiwanensis]TFF82543.1 ABC transporter substrate-binding protein [Aeromonas taiwanensis]
MRLVTLLLLLCPTLFTSLPARAVVVVAADIPPYVIRSQQGAPSGMAIEVLEEAARRLGETLEIELMPLARALSQTRHRPDVLLLPPARNPQRESQFLWIAPLLEEAFVLVSHRNHHPAPLTVADLPGLTVGAMRGSHGQSLIPLLEGVTQELVSEEINNASKLARGRIQGWAVAWNTARYNQQRAGLPLPDLVRGQTLQRSTLYLAASPRFSPSEAMRWRRVIQEMRQDGSLARILFQYDYQAP